MTLKRTLLTSALIVFSLLVFAQEVPKLGKNSVNEVVKAMTLEEKAALVVGTGFYMPGVNMPGLAAIEPGEGHKRVPGASGAVYAIPRLGIPAVVVTDGPAGVHIFNAGKGRQYFATAWPSGTLLASTWDTTLVKNVGAAFGAEAKEYGVDVVLGPGMNIHRNPLGARNFEYYSEDPVLTGYIAAAMIDGIQSKGVGTSAKHYAANNQETNRGTVNTILSERALREVYLRGWEIAVKKSSPWTIMSSYNKINGIYTSESYDLLTNVLRKDWGYKA
jgi:beta-glucosidase